MMHIEEFEKLLSEKLGNAFEEKLGEKIREFGGLLTRRAAVMLLCRQNGIEVEKKASLGSLASMGALPFSFSAKVERIFPVQSYPNGADRSVRLHISDGSGQAILVLWNDQVKIAEEDLSSGDGIECTGAYLRGSEIQVGKNGAVKKLSGNSPLKVSQLTAGICSVEGVVGEVEPDYVYIDKKTGLEKSLSSFMLCEGDNCRRVVAWSFPQGAGKPSEGDVLRLENVVFKNSELHLNSSSRLVKKSSANDRTGTLQEIIVGEAEAAFLIDGKKYVAPTQEALALLGIKSVPPGVSPSTLLSIKSQELCGKKARYTVSGRNLRSIYFFGK